MISTRKVICRADTRDSRAKEVQSGNRKQTTAIIAVSASEQTLPPYIIILAAEKHQSQWYRDIPRNYRMSLAKDGWTNDKQAWVDFKTALVFIQLHEQLEDIIC